MLISVCNTVVLLGEGWKGALRAVWGGVGGGGRGRFGPCGRFEPCGAVWEEGGEVGGGGLSTGGREGKVKKHTLQ